MLDMPFHLQQFQYQSVCLNVVWLATFRTRGVAYWHVDSNNKINIVLYIMLFLLNIAGKLHFLWKYQKATGM